MAFVGLRQMPFLVIMWLRSWTKLLMSQRKILWRLLRKERLLMGKGSNPNSLKGLKIGWDNSELRKNPLNHKICLICNKNFIRRGKKKFTAKCCSSKCRTKLWKGKNHPLYKATNRSDRNMIYNSKRYKYWRTKVFIRDEFTCVECGQIGGKLEAHHIKAYALYPKLRFITENGVTL